MPETVRAHVRIAGKVQGVWFRQSTRDQGERLGLSGWVRNLATGQVETLFEGDEASVEALIAWCRRGPPHARVEEVFVDRAPSSLGDLPKPFSVAPTP